MASIARVSFAQMQTQRACYNCGTTKTPQWREGPEGPKTLCNACGVKRNRQLNKAHQARLAERRPEEAPAGGAAPAQPQPKTPLPPSALLYERDEAAAVSSIVAAAAAASSAAAQAASTAPRAPPRRQSAQRSMDALATFINSGGNGTVRRHREGLKGDAALMPPPQRPRRGSDTTGGSDTDVDMDELRPPSPPATASPSKLGGPVRVLPPPCEACATGAETLDAVALLAMRHEPPRGDRDPRFAAGALKKMPAAELERLSVTAANEAVAAEAAVNAVARVLAHKQALVIRSVENHKAAVAALQAAKRRQKRKGQLGGGGG